MTVDPKLKQRTDALAKAQKVRLAKAELKRKWAAGDPSRVLTEIADCLDGEDCGSLDAFKVVELLTTVPGIGKTKARLIANSADWIELTHKISRLTMRQRGLLSKALRQRARDVEQRVSSAA